MSLARHLTIQRQALTDFIVVLEDEQQVLSQPRGDGVQLGEIAKRKQDMLPRLDNLDSIRIKAQRKLGYPDGLQGGHQAAADAQCTELWDEILNLASRAKQLNELNGSVIKVLKDQNQRMFGFLQEASGESTYGPDGKARRKGLAGVSTRV